MNKWKPAVENIIDLRHKGEEYYGPWWDELVRDEKFFELDFKSELGLPVELIHDGIVLPTGRQLIYTYADNVDTLKASVFVNKKGDSKADEEEADMERKFGQGVLYRNNVEASIAPLRTVSIHQPLYGRACTMTCFDADMWPDKPEQKKNESDSEYADRLDEFRRERGSRLPIRMRPVNPRNVIPDWSHGGSQWVIEVQKKICLDVAGQWKKWSNPKGRKIDEEVTLTSFWNQWYRCELADDEPLFRVGDGVVAHKYGFLPYTFMDSGLGNESYDNDPVKRYVGLLRYIHDVLISDSRNYSLADISYKKGSLPWYTIEGDGSDQVTILKPEYGVAQPLPKGTTITAQIPQIVPEAVNRHWERTQSVIAAFAAPRSVQGLPEAGTRSAAQFIAMRNTGGVRFDYPTESFRNGVADILGKALMIQKRVIPDGVRVWARTPTDEWDIVMDPKKIREPVTYYVQFAPDEIDRYRKNDDLERRVKIGFPLEWAGKQMSDVNWQNVQVQIQKQKYLDTMAPSLMQLAVSRRAQTLGLTAGAPVPQPVASPLASQEPGRAVIAPSSPKPEPLSARSLDLQMQTMRGPSMTQQGMGGGGNRPI